MAVHFGALDVEFRRVDGSQPAQQTQIKPSGEFEFEDLSPGDYGLTIRDTGGNPIYEEQVFILDDLNFLNVHGSPGAVKDRAFVESWLAKLQR